MGALRMASIGFQGAMKPRCIPKLWVGPNTSCALNPGSAAIPGRHSMLPPCGTGQSSAPRSDLAEKSGMHGNHPCAASIHHPRSWGRNALGSLGPEPSPHPTTRLGPQRTSGNPFCVNAREFCSDEWEFCSDTREISYDAREPCLSTPAPNAPETNGLKFTADGRPTGHAREAVGGVDE